MGAGDADDVVRESIFGGGGGFNSPSSGFDLSPFPEPLDSPYLSETWGSLRGFGLLSEHTALSESIRSSDG